MPEPDTWAEAGAIPAAIPPSIRTLIDAVLYEGYVLYPYRASALKNRQRWTFGGLFPQSYVAAHDGERGRMQVQCLLAGHPASLSLRLRFLQVVNRQVYRIEGTERPPHWQAVAELEIDGQRYVTWDEALEREVVVDVADLQALCAQPRRERFRFAAVRETEYLRDARDRTAGVLVRRREALAGTVQLWAEAAGEDLRRLTVQIFNDTPLAHAEAVPRAAAQGHAFASAHVLLAAPGASFISLTDPPPALSEAAAACRNEGAWPVLVGEAGQQEWMLASPIILYDHPRVAPESRGDLFDGTEIDEILSLRVLAMSSGEQREIEAVDARTRALLARTAAMTPPQWQLLHGTFREAPPRLASLRRGDAALRVGARVRLHPRRDGDIMDLALAGRTGVIEGIETDFEDRVHVAIAIDGDPGRDLGLARMPGHRFFFRPEELVLLDEAVGA